MRKFIVFVIVAVLSTVFSLSLSVNAQSEAAELKSLGVAYTPSTNYIENAKDISVITDGIRGTVDNWNSENFDTFQDFLNDGEEEPAIQVAFDKNCIVSEVIFVEGGIWNDGGWFGVAPRIQIFLDGTWKDVESKCSPDYPDDDYDLQMPVCDAYTFTLANPTACDGIRVIGEANSFAGHVSCSEIEVYGELFAKDDSTAPTTADFASVAVLVTCITAAGAYTISRKKK